MSDHPSPAELAAFCRRSGLAPEREAVVVHHLLFQRCPECLEAIAQKAGRNLQRKVGDLPLMTIKLAQSWQIRGEDPQGMVTLAWGAAMLSLKLDRGAYGPQRVCDYQAAAQAELSNAFRVANRPSDAQLALARARQRFEEGTRDEFLEVRLLELEASLHAYLREFVLAVHKLLPVLAFYEQHDDSHRLGRTLVLLGLYLGYGGDHAHAIRRLEQSLLLIDAKRDPGVAYCAAHNLILFLVESDRFREARKLCILHSRLLLHPGGRINKIKFRALEGQIAAGAGDYSRAETIFQEVITGLEGARLPIQAGINRLHLAAALLHQRKPATGVILEAAEAFVLHKVRREALAVMIMLRDAFKQGMGTLEMVLEVAAFLRQLELDPSVRFEGRAWELPEGPGK